MYFVNTTLFLSVEAKIKYLFPLLSSMYPSILLKQDKEDLHYVYLNDLSLM